MRWTARRRAATTFAVAAAAVASLAGPAAADRHPQSAGYSTQCPPAESLVTGSTWHTHRLAPGVTLREARRGDKGGYVDMHVLDVDVTNRHLSFEPLVRRLAERTPLTSLAANRAGLVAATNTGYFDFEEGTPLGPLVDRAQPWVTSSVRTTVVGFSKAGLVQAGHLSLSGVVAAGHTTQRLSGLNVAVPGNGLTAYTPRWGRAGIAIPWDAVTRYVEKGRVASTVGTFDTAPSGNGYLLVARGAAATTWLASLRQGQPVTVSTSMSTDAAHPFAQAYGVGTQVVRHGGIVAGLTCRRRYPQPARTAIGFADGGRQLILAVVADHPGTSQHGLDATQTGRLMQDLGATDAYLFDGSGSTEMLARMPADPSTLSMRNYPADGAERAMPVGFGIFRR